MAVRIYYGTCNSAATDEIKAVKIRSGELQEQEYTFEIGDLLVVYMAFANEVKEPSIVILTNDVNYEPSIADDTGKSIKIQNTVADAAGAWDNGETVVFAYTGNINDNDNVYYWELINGAHSTTEIYGVTQLFGDKDTSLSDWMDGEIEDDDYKKALTPAMLKKFYKVLMRDEDEEESESPLIALTWNPKDEGNLDTLGYLSLNNKTGTGIEITYPLGDFINTKIGELTIPEATSDIKNTGEDPEKENSRENGKFYLTNILPLETTDGVSTQPFSLQYMNGNTPYSFIYPNGTQGGGWLVLQGRNGVRIDSNTVINGTLSVSERLTASGGITSAGSIDAGNNLIQTTGQLKGGTLFENYNGSLVALNTKYSGILDVQRVWFAYMSPKSGQPGPLKIAASSTCGHRYLTLTRTGYKPLGVMGYNFNYANKDSNGDAAWCHLWECSITNDKLQYAIRNHKNKQVIIEGYFDILYVKNV